jgi:hypothetical protein
MQLASVYHKSGKLDKALFMAKKAYNISKERSKKSSRSKKRSFINPILLHILLDSADF